jgi:hypothetical protein
MSVRTAVCPRGQLLQAYGAPALMRTEYELRDEAFANARFPTALLLPASGAQC